MTKRKQIKLNQYHLSNVVEKDNKLTIVGEPKQIAPFYNFFVQSIEHRLNEEMPMNAYFILKFEMMNEDDEEDKEMMNLYERALREGLWIDDVKYVKSIKSPSMSREQKTTFIRADIAEDIMDRVALGKIPTHTVVSKLEAAYGISLSSVIMTKKIPNIVFIKDYGKNITEDIEVLKEYPLDEDATDSIDRQIEADEQNKKAWKEYKPTDEELKKLKFFAKSTDDEKSKSGWLSAGRRIKIDEINKPKGYGEYSNKNNKNIYPLYDIEQTEERMFPKCSSGTIGKKIEHLENHSVPMTMFDGQALGSFEWFKEVSNDLQLKYTTNAVQGRLPYFKGLIIRFNIKKWARDNNVTHITDLFGESHSIENIDIIATESCWKVFHDYSTGEKRSLFQSADEYYKQLEKYGITQFGIANHAKSEKKQKEYARLNYQFIYALPNITFKDLKSLSKPFEKLIYKVKEGKDIAYIKAFLNHLYEPEKEVFTNKCLELLSIDDRLMHDKKIKMHVLDQVGDMLRDLKQGRIPIRGGYRYLTQDPVAFIEYATGKEVKGFLDTPYTVFKEGAEGHHLLMRNPTTSPKEVVKAKFIKSDNEHVKHLDSIIITSIHDLLLPKFTADVDGDIALLTKEPRLLNAIHESVPLIHLEDKQFQTGKKADYQEYNIDSVIEYEKRNTNSMIGVLTNWNTKFLDLAISHDSYGKVDLVVSTNKIYQMMLIDAAKTGEKVDIAYPIAIHGKKLKKPLFMQSIYNEKAHEYDEKSNSPLNKYYRYICKREEKLKEIVKESTDNTYEATEVLERRDKLPSDAYLYKLMKGELLDLYTAYSKEREKINKLNNEYEDTPTFKKDPAKKELIRSKYKEVADKYREKAREVESNLSILATAAVGISYREKQRYQFAWDVAYEGMVDNALHNRLNKIQEVVELGKIKLNGHEGITGVAQVIDGKMYIKQVEVDVNESQILEEEIVVDTTLEDGKYGVFTVLDKHYAVMEIDNEQKNKERLELEWPTLGEESETKEFEKESMRLLIRKTFGSVKGTIKATTYTIKVDINKGYVNLYDEDDYVMSIAKDSIVKHELNRNYDGWNLKVLNHDTTDDELRSLTARVKIFKD